MKLVLNFIVAVIYVQYPALAQEKEVGNKEISTGWSNTASLGIQFPLGEFSETHGIGVGVIYTRTDHRFGRLKENLLQKFGFTYESGITYYPGKKEKFGQVYTYDYPHFVYLHAYGGLIYNPCSNGNIRVVAGPALGLYDGDTRFNIGAAIDGTYYPARRIGISPAFTFMKESGTGIRVAASIRGTFAF